MQSPEHGKVLSPFYSNQKEARTPLRGRLETRFMQHIDDTEVTLMFLIDETYETLGRRYIYIKAPARLASSPPGEHTNTTHQGT